MIPEKRREEIVAIVNERKSITSQELIDIFNSSESTIRRDITELAKEGKILKVFGGAMALDDDFSTEEMTIIQKEKLNREEKIKIAIYAAGLIEPGDYIFIDSGSTTGLMVNYIFEKNATYITNAFSHAKVLIKKGLKTILIGGELKGNTEAIVGEDAILQVKKYNFTKGFFGTNGITLKNGLTTPDVRESLLKKVAMDKTKRGERYILADSSKFGQISAVTFGNFEGIKVITNEMPEEKYAKKIFIKVV